jgi:hypothetical protein
MAITALSSFSIVASEKYERETYADILSTGDIVSL